MPYRLPKVPTVPTQKVSQSQSFSAPAEKSVPTPFDEPADLGIMSPVATFQASPT